MIPPAHLVDLHGQIQASVGLLDTLESFLSTFQTDLAAVSGQISDLQARSSDIDARLQSRKKIERSLSGLLYEIALPPAIVTTILDSQVDEPWIQTIAGFERCLDALRPRSNLAAANNMLPLVEALTTVAATKIRAFFCSVLAPLRSAMSTNLPVLQSTVLMKYHPLFVFLKRRAVDVANEINSLYIVLSRTYYETGFRRYTRSLGQIKSRTGIKSAWISLPGKANEPAEDLEQVKRNASLQDTGVTLAYFSDTRAYVESTSSLFRSMILVLLDNATVEYMFLNRFFHNSTVTAHHDGGGLAGDARETGENEAELAPPNALWNEIFEPTIGCCNVLLKLIKDSSPPVIQLLTMAKLNDAALKENEVRGCLPLEAFLHGVRLALWPAFQKQMNDHIETVKKYADGLAMGISTKIPQKDSALQSIIINYTTLFITFVAISESDDAIVFSNLFRLRQEISRSLPQPKAAGNGQDGADNISMYNAILQELAQCDLLVAANPKMQAEVAFWTTKREDAQRRRLTIRV